jgi:hypothetical protein
LGDTVVNAGKNGNDEKNESGNREEIEPETKVVILERGKKAGDVHYKITKYILVNKRL